MVISRVTGEYPGQVVNVFFQLLITGKVFILQYFADLINACYERNRFFNIREDRSLFVQYIIICTNKNGVMLLLLRQWKLQVPVIPAHIPNKVVKGIIAHLGGFTEQIRTYK
jgi:hypothetical protein